MRACTNKDPNVSDNAKAAPTCGASRAIDGSRANVRIGRNAEKSRERPRTRKPKLCTPVFFPTSASSRHFANATRRELLAPNKGS